MSLVHISPEANASLYGASQEPIAMVMEETAEAMDRISVANLIFNKMDSDGFALALTGVTSLGDFEDVGEAGAYPENGFQEGFKKVIYPHEWKNSFSITQTMREDNKILDMKNLGRSLIKSSKRTREKFFAALLGGAYQGNTVSFAGKNYDVTAEDGKSLFNKEHISKTDKKLIQSNMFAGDLTAANLSKIETQMQNFCDDNGNLLDIAPDTIIIPNISALKDAAFEAVASEKSPNTSTNAMNYQFGRWNIIVWNYLNRFIVSKNGAMPYIVMDSNYNEEALGAVANERVALKVKSYIDNKNDNNVWSGRERYSGGFKDWRAFAIGGITDGTALA